ncbi:MAG: hypothetical protein D6820_13740, partial [Lentisphaerae bacterium]
EINFPEHKMMFCDSGGAADIRPMSLKWEFESGVPEYDKPDGRHPGHRANLAAVDGHAEAVSAWQLYQTRSDFQLGWFRTRK